MSSYALAFGILIGGVLGAAFLWLLPKGRARRKVRKFRKELANVHLVSIVWQESFGDRPASDEVPGPQPLSRRQRRQNRPA